MLSLPITFVYDNYGHNAESIYNATVHKMNGIVIQMKNNNKRNSSNQKNPATRSTTNVRRSFKPVLQEVQPLIKPKQHPNPKPIQNANNDINY